MKKGLIMEGGAMRGMYTAGVTDVFMENGITFDGAIGVSAGAIFGCNYKSNQPGRTIRYNKKYCNDRRYSSIKSLITTGNLYNVEFAYKELPTKLDPFDAETFSNSPMEFYVVATDIESGEAVYYKCDKGDSVDIDWMRASAAMPIFTKVVELDGYKLSDGGAADSIPINYLESLGYDRNVVILTQPKGFVKTPNKYMPLLRRLFRKYPNFINTLEHRHEIYNDTIRYIDEREKEGNTFVIRPSEPLNIGAREKDERELERVYQIGRKDALKKVGEVKSFLA